MQLGGACWLVVVLVACASAATLPSVGNETASPLPVIPALPREGVDNETASPLPVIPALPREGVDNETASPLPVIPALPREGVDNETELTGSSPLPVIPALPREGVDNETASPLPIIPALPREGVDNETEVTERSRRDLSADLPLPRIQELPRKGVMRAGKGPYGYNNNAPKEGVKFRFDPDTNQIETETPEEDLGGGVSDIDDNEAPAPDHDRDPDPDPDQGGEVGIIDDEKDRVISQKNVALVRWTQANAQTNDKKYNTVGALIAINAVITTPSGRVPVSRQDTSNWNVDSIRFPLVKKTIKGKDIVVIYHPDFSMNPDGTSRLALVMLTPGVQRATKTMMPIKMVASPFLREDAMVQQDAFSLSNCVMVVNTPRTLEVQLIPMTATTCRYNLNARKTFTDKICANIQMRKDSPDQAYMALEYKGDLGSPLICGNVLVGVYAGVQNTRGTYHHETGGDPQRNIMLTTKLLEFDQMYTFTVPGAVPNYDFITGFVNEDTKIMRWSPKIDLKETNECEQGGEISLPEPSPGKPPEEETPEEETPGEIPPEEGPEPLPEPDIGEPEVGGTEDRK